MTAVQSLPHLQSLSRLGWSSSGSGGDTGVSAEEVRTRASAGFSGYGLQRNNSSGSNSSDSSTNTGKSGAQSEEKVVIQQEAPTGSRFGRALASLRNDRVTESIPLANSQPLISTPKIMQNTNQPIVNGNRMAPQPAAQEIPALLVLLPVNGTFERKQINVPLFPEVLRIGRQTNAKTVPTPANGYFDSKVLSRQHAEVWADRSGKVWIRDVKSSNGTFVNGVRLSPESRDSEPHELRENDMLELGIDIVSEDQKSIVHHKVSAKIEHAGVPTNTTSVLDLNMADIEPGSGGGLSLPLTNGTNSRRMSNSSLLSSNGRPGNYQLNGNQTNGYGLQRHMGAWISPVSIEQVVKRLATELRQAKQQSQDLDRTGEFIHTLLGVEPGQEVPKAPSDLFQPPPVMNGFVPHKEHISPFSAPPAPPPQLPLPEKPDGPPATSPDRAIIIKKTETSPINGKVETSSQILQLVEALSLAKKELDNQSNRVKELEEELRQERKSREFAEERMRVFLENLHISSNRTDKDETSSIASDETAVVTASDDSGERSAETEAVASSTTRLQERLDSMLQEMRELKDEMETYKHRAEVAEEEKSGLVEMVEQIRSKEREIPNGSTTQTRSKDKLSGSWSNTNGNVEEELELENQPTKTNGSVKSNLQQKQLQELASAAMSLQRDDKFIQSAPYASIVGVVLIGVGIMTYLNGWQKLEAS